MENIICEVCREDALSFCACSTYLCKNHVEDHKCSDLLNKIIISLYINIDEESRKKLFLYLEQIKSIINSSLSLPRTDARYHSELCRQIKQVDNLLEFVQNAKYIKNDLFLSPIEFFLSRPQDETNKFIEEISLENIFQNDVIDFLQIEKIILHIYNFNYFTLIDLMGCEINWILENNNDLFAFSYQRGIECLWFKKYYYAKISFLLCKSISEKVISYSNICKEILNLALSVTDQIFREKETAEISLSIKQTKKNLILTFPAKKNLIAYEVSRIYVSIENYKKAIKYSLECEEGVQDEREKFYIWLYIGFLYQSRLDLENAKFYYDKCENSIDSSVINSQSELQNWYLNIAEFHILKGEYEIAIEKYIFGINLCKKKPKNYQIYINLHFKLAEAYNYLNNFEKSKQHYLKAKNKSQKYKKINLIDIYLKLSELYLKNFEFEQAKKMAKKCLKLCKNSEFIETMKFSSAYRILGNIKLSEVNFEKCELFLWRSINFCQKNPNSNWLYFIIELNIFEFYIITHNFNEADNRIQRLNEKIEKLKDKNNNSFLFYDILCTFYLFSQNIDQVNTLIDIWQQNRKVLLQHDSDEKGEIYCLNALKSIYLKDYEESESWLMKWKIYLNSKKLLDKWQFLKFNYLIGTLYYISSKYDAAIDLFLESTKLFEQCCAYDNPKLGDLFLHIGVFYGLKQELKQSVDYFAKSFYIFGIKLESFEIIFNLYNNIAVSNLLINLEESENFFIEAAYLHRKMKVKNLKTHFAFCLNQAYWWIIIKENVTEVKIWINESKKFTYDKIPNSVERSYIKALVWFIQENYQKAKEILIKSLKRLKRNYSEHYLFEKLYNIIAVCYKMMNQAHKSEKYMEKYTRILIKRNDPVSNNDNIILKFNYIS